MLTRREAMIKALLIVDEKRRRLFHLEGRQPSVFPPRLLERDPAADDLTDGQPGADFVQDLGAEAAILIRFAAR
jgi:hypothetical protein